jgi:membrane protein DedA with SNARE-associated domain
MGLLHNFLNWSLAALDHYGYAIVFGATVLENIFIVGSFTPGDVITTSAAFTASTPAGNSTNVWGIFAVAVLGTWIGTNISYVIGARGGKALIERVGPRFGISVEAIEAGDEYFDQRGPATIIFARFVAVLKNLAPTIAGASRLKLWVFEVYSLIGAVLYAGILVALGWFLGANFQQGLKYFGAFSWVMFIVVLIGIVAVWQGKRRRDKRVVKRQAARFEADHGRLACDDETEECSDAADDDGTSDDDA